MEFFPYSFARFCRTGVICLFTFAAAAVASAGVPVADGEEITYAKHISRLLQAKCQECHHPDAVAPFSLMTYRQAVGWSAMIKEVVLDGRMPPWHADPNHGEFKNDRSLSEEQKQMLVSWVDNGMPRGKKEDMPEPLEFHGSWKIGEPEVVFELPEEVTVDPTGVVPYLYFNTPTNFEEDKYVKFAQALPGNSKVVHHIIVSWFLPEGTPPAKNGMRQGFIVGTAPGDMPLRCPPNHGRYVPAGAVLRWQMHYTPTGKLETDRSKLGFVFCDETPDHLIETESPSNHNIRIPAHAENHREEWMHTVDEDRLIVSFMPHMHLRGKSFRYTAIYPNGEEEVLLWIPNYDFNWQAQYHLAEPKHIPSGTKLHLVAHYDNSENNAYNPDPDKPVRWGDQTWEEMMIGWYDYVKAEPGAVTGD